MSRSLKWLAFLLFSAAVAAAVWFMTVKLGSSDSSAPAAAEPAFGRQTDPSAADISGAQAAEEIQADLQQVEVTP